MNYFSRKNEEKCPYYVSLGLRELGCIKRSGPVMISPITSHSIGYKHFVAVGCIEFDQLHVLYLFSWRTFFYSFNYNYFYY